MSYQVLARKWRPQKFSEVVGQRSILTALTNALNSQRLHHAYLFSGTRGVGKTSIARLFAKSLNCLNGVSADPCGKCEHCKAIEEGHFIDLIEIDAASRTKVEDTRELLDNVQYKPTVGRYKVYLIDEVHMLSRHSFNALLKTLEEPPEYVKFLLATTDPHKLPITILSRCLQFHLKALQPEQIVEHLTKVLKQENFVFEANALDPVAKAAQGSLRDALSLTDQAIALGDGNISFEVVRQMLGMLDGDQTMDILYALAQGNGEKLMKAVESVACDGGDWTVLLNDVIALLHHIAIKQWQPQPTSAGENPISFLAKRIAPEEIQLFYQILVTGKPELDLAPNRRIAVEMLLLRALAFAPAQETAKDSALTQPEKVVQISAITPIEKNALSNNFTESAVKNRENTIQNVDSSASLPQIDAAAQDKITEKNVIDIDPTVQSALNALDRLNQVIPNADKKPQEFSEVTEKKNRQQETGEFSLEEQSAIENRGTPNPPSNSESSVTNIAPEDYRWTWTNPEKNKEEESIRPSDIKAALSQKTTKSLRERIIRKISEQDTWCEFIEKLGVSGLTREFLFNTVLLQQTDDMFILGLRSCASHLCYEQSITRLTDIISQHCGHKITLEIRPNDETELSTPMEQYRRIYTECYEQAKRNLQQDPKIQLLEQYFNARLVTESIRPV